MKENTGSLATLAIVKLFDSIGTIGTFAKANKDLFLVQSIICADSTSGIITPSAPEKDFQY